VTMNSKPVVSGLVVCVDYGDYLEQTLPAWAADLDRLVVVTAAGDRATLAACARFGVRAHVTDAFYRFGAAFNKGGALDEGLAALDAPEWVLLFDADIAAPEGWRAKLDLAALSPGHLYTATRQDAHGEIVNDPQRFELPGYFLLFHARDPVAQDRPLFGDWHNASGYDTVFSRRWRQEMWRRLPFVVTHLGETRRHWCGRDNVAGMIEMDQRRRLLSGFLHERLR
jgi:glycosyltransferase involved in cell wall biosynthesis